MSSSDDPAPAIPRPSATVLLLRDDPFEVLMVRRRAGGSFSSALVFPGGVVEPDDADPAWLTLADGAAGLDDAERTLRIAGCRETFEEVGVLIGSGSPDPGAPFRAALAAAGGRLAIGAMARFGHWITPEALPKRWDTHFYLAAMPAGQDPVADGGETVSLEWVRVADAAETLAEDRALHFPTRLNLARLAESANVAEAFAAARARPAFTVVPVITMRDGASVTLIPAEAGYGVTEELRGERP